MKYLFTLFTLTAVLTVMSACTQHEQAETADERTDTIPQLVTQIQRCSRLYTTEYRISKIVTHDDVVRLKGNFLQKDFDITLPMGERKIAIPMHATLKAYIDFSDFSERNIERYGNRIVILLPDPKVVLTSSKVSHEDIKEYVGLVRSHFTDSEMASYEQQGRKALLKSAATMNLLPAAQANAARVLVPMLAEMGYREEDITIAFRRDISLERIINSDIEQ